MRRAEPIQRIYTVYEDLRSFPPSVRLRRNRTEFSSSFRDALPKFESQMKDGQKKSFERGPNLGISSKVVQDADRAAANLPRLPGSPPQFAVFGLRSSPPVIVQC